MWFSVILYWRVVYNIHFRYCIKGLFFSNRGTDALGEVIDLDENILQEDVDIPLYCDDYCLWIKFG